MIWVIGAKGMLGTELCDQLQSRDLPFCSTDRETSILDVDALRGFAARHAGIDTIVNCSAYTAVDRAEDDADAAFSINSRGAAHIGQVAQEVGARLVHVSTDYVYPGSVDHPIGEEAETGPLSVYGRSKLEGDELIQQTLRDYVIVRTAWLYGMHGNNFVYTMLKLMNSKEEINVVDDQWGAPTNAIDLASAILGICIAERFVPGVFHYTGQGRCSWFQFASRIYERGRDEGIIRSECRIEPIHSEHFPTKADRPRFSMLDSAKISREYGIETERWEVALDTTIARLASILPLMRNHLRRSDVAHRSALSLSESIPSEYVPFLCAESVRELLSSLLLFRSQDTERRPIEELAVCAPVAFDDCSLDTIRFLTEFESAMTESNGPITEYHEDLLQELGRLRNVVLERTVLEL